MTNEDLLKLLKLLSRYEETPVRLTTNQYVLEMIEEFNLNAKLCHWSCGDISFDMIRRHREKGFKTTIEVRKVLDQE